MLKAINREYETVVSAGEKVEQIALSQIAMDHLNSELQNSKTPPEWLELVEVQSNISGYRIYTGKGEQV